MYQPIQNKEKIQKWFNTAYNGLRTQEFKQSLNGYGACDFRGRDGMKCAVGHLVTDEDLQKVNNGNYAYPDMVRTYLTMNDPSEDLFLVNLMESHDSGKDPETMKFNLAQLAKRYDLTVPQ